MTLIPKPGTSWSEIYSKCVSAAPEAFGPEHLRNLTRGNWSDTGRRVPHVSPIDGSPMVGPSIVDARFAVEAVEYTSGAHQDWSRIPLDQRRELVSEALELLTAERDLLALLLVWEIGKPWRLALADVDRCLDGVRWYVEEIERQLGGFGHRRDPLPGPVSNIASWNYPMSVQVHAELVQLLAGNAVVAKTPEPGRLPLPDPGPRPHAPGRPAGDPALGRGPPSRRGAHPQRGHRGPGLRRRPGQRAAGRRLPGRHAAGATCSSRRASTPGASGTSPSGHLLAQHLRKGFEYAKQRCTAYPRFVVQRRLFHRLPGRLPAGRGEVVRFGHPLAVADRRRPFPRPRLRSGHPRHQGRTTCAGQLDEARDAVAASRCYRGSSATAACFLDAQDDRAPTWPPACVLAAGHVVVAPPRRAVRPARLGGPRRHRGRAGGGHERQQRLPGRHHRHRRPGLRRAGRRGSSRPSRSASTRRAAGATARRSSAGSGQSWKGAFVGGDLLVQAVTYGPNGADEDLYGNYPARLVLPTR